MGTIIVKNAVVREPGYMYYIDGQGNLCSSKMQHGGRKKGAKAKGKKTAKKTTVKKKAK